MVGMMYWHGLGWLLVSLRSMEYMGGISVLSCMILVDEIYKGILVQGT